MKLLFTMFNQMNATAIILPLTSKELPGKNGKKVRKMNRKLKLHARVQTDKYGAMSTDDHGN